MSAGAESLGALLALRRDEIVAEFVAEVRRAHVAPDEAPRALLVDHVPGFLEELSADLAASGADAGAEVAEAAMARSHGRSRWAAGYDLVSVVREYDLLRRCIVRRALEEHGEIATDAMETLARALNRGISEAVVGYTTQREAEVSEAARRAEIASRAKDDFLSVVSHELRTPLNAILGWAQILTRSATADPDLLRRGLAVIYRNARAQTRIVDDILDAARLASSGLVVARQPTALEPVIRAAVESSQPEIDARVISLTLTLDPTLHVLGDPDRLRQVVWNLLSNAIKFTPERGDVAVRLERSGAVARLTVTDSGRGIAAADLPHVFDRFSQADSSTSRSTGGLGLGLAIVQQVVTAHGGVVDASSGGVGLGTTFTVELPVASQRGGPLGALVGIEILLVEDDPDAAEFVVLLLSNQGAEVRRAVTVEEALAALATFTPHVVVSDLGLSSEDGFSLIRRLRGLPPPLRNLPALAFTAYQEASTVAAVLEAGFDEHLAKPSEPERLVEAVERLARRGAVAAG